MLSKGTAGDGPVQGEAHHQQAPCKACRFLDRAWQQTAAAALQIRDPVFDSPAHAVIEDGMPVRGDRHRHDPRLLLACCMQRAAVARDAAALECRAAAAGRNPGRHLAGAQGAACVGHGPMAWQAPTVRPAGLLAPAHPLGRPLQALRGPQERARFRHPRLPAVPQLLLDTKAKMAWR